MERLQDLEGRPRRASIGVPSLKDLLLRVKRETYDQGEGQMWRDFLPVSRGLATRGLRPQRLALLSSQTLCRFLSF